MAPKTKGKARVAQASIHETQTLEGVLILWLEFHIESALV
jgi:hypothetical protein